MLKTKNAGFIIGSMGLYFGWLLSFPLFGPVSTQMEVLAGNQSVSISFVFVLFQALTYFAGGIFSKNLHHAHKFMMGGLGVALLLNILLLLRIPMSFWVPVMALMAVASSIFVLGWGKMFSMSMDLNQKQRAMALIIIISNLFYVLFNHLSNILGFYGMVLAGTGLLILSAVCTIHPRIYSVEKKVEEEDPKKGAKSLLVVFCIFFFILNLNGGLLYTNIMPTVNQNFPVLENFEFTGYISMLVILYVLTGRYKLERLVFLGASILGLSFISFALFYDNLGGVILTAVLTDSAFAMLDLFLWTTLGVLSFVYRMPYRFYGFVLAANVSSILVGGIVGQQIAVSENHAAITAFFAAAIIFLIFAIMPFIQDRIRKDLQRLESTQPEQKEPDGDKAAAVQVFLRPGETLTPKEAEVLELIFSGMTNQEMADALYISINTLKTHLRHMYNKFGVQTKKQLMDLANGDE